MNETNTNNPLPNTLSLVKYESSQKSTVETNKFESIKDTRCAKEYSQGCQYSSVCTLLMQDDIIIGAITIWCLLMFSLIFLLQVDKVKGQNQMMPDFGLKSSGLRFGHINVCHLLPKIDQIRLMLSNRGSDLDILSINESFLNASHDDSLAELNNFNMYRKDRVNKKGGGIIIYVKNQLISTRRVDLEHSHIECVWIELTVSNHKNILVGSFYRPPNSKVDWYEHLEECMEKAYDDNKDIVIMGDFNIDLNLNNTQSQKLLGIMDSFGLNQMVKTSTRVTCRSSTLIDHIYVTNSDSVKDLCVPQFSPSDHYPVCFVWNIHGKRYSSNGLHKSIKYRSSKKFNSEMFLSDLMSAPWELIEQCYTVDEALSMWMKLFTEVMDNHLPIKEKRIKNKSKPEWINDEILYAMKQRDYFRTNDNTKYKLWRNKVVSLTKSAKSSFYQKAINENKKNPKELWKMIKSVTSKKPVNTVTELLVDDQTIRNPLHISNEFNKYFSSVSSKLIDKRNSCLDPNHKEKLISFVNDKINSTSPFNIPEMTHSFVAKCLYGLKENKATGLDGLMPWILKISAPVISRGISWICNKSIQQSTFPNQWKTARITPIHKKGATNNAANYRPISILNVLSKILERHVHYHLYKYLNENGLITRKQSGFRSKHSCQTSLLYLTNEWFNAIENGNLIGTVLVDLRKAFDLVNHELLLQKLAIYNCSTASTTWFRSYLNNRSQIVSIDGQHSEERHIISGVPQGSILGPLLFIMYINDLTLGTSHEDISLYADDTTVYAVAKRIEDINQCLNSTLTHITEWCEKNDMVVNEEKTTAICIRSARKASGTDHNLRLVINNQNVATTEDEKLLGVHLDSSLSWNNHIKHVKKTVQNRLNLLKYLKSYLPLQARIMYYNAYVLPHFDYCSVVWSNTSGNKINELFKLQKRAARMILNKKYDTPSSALFSELQWLPLPSRFKFNVCIEVYKALNNLSPGYMADMFSTTPRNLRSSTTNKVFVPRASKKSFAFYGATLWNSLSNDVRSQDSLDHFRRKLKEHLIMADV